MSSAAEEIGKVIGKYEILEVIGEGGMGVVYKVRHTLIGRKAALKMLHREFASRPSVVERFFTEATAVNKIQHQNIVDISDYGQTEDGRCYFIMELLEGRELARELEPARPLDLRRAFHIVLQIASALRASHRAGIIHRDLKPENIFLIRLGADPDFVKILDFGIAKLFEAPQEGGPREKTILQEEYQKRRLGIGLPSAVKARPQTRLGAMLGTPGYMAPEQIMGKPVDPRADIYALGMIFYELLTGEPAFYAENDADLILKVLAGNIVPPRAKNPRIPPEFDALIVKAAQKEKEARFQSVDDLLDALYQAEIKAVERGEMAPAMILASSSMSLPVISLPGYDSGGYPTAKTGEHVAASRPPLVLPDPPARHTPLPPLPGDLHPPSQGRLRRAIKGTLFAAFLLALFGAITHLFSPDPEGERSSAAASAPTRSPASVSLPAQPEAKEVKIAVLSEPAGALVTEGDTFWGKTPCLLEIEPSPRARTIQLSLEGYAPVHKTFVPDEDQSLHLILKELPREESAGEKKATKSESDQKKTRRPEPPPSPKSEDSPRRESLEGTLKVKF